MKKHLKMFVAMMLTLALFMGTFPMAVASDDAHAMETPDVSMPEVTEVLTSVDTDSALEEQSPSDEGIALLSLDTETQDNNQILSIHVDEIRIGQSFEISWSGVDRIDHYEIAIVRIDENGNETYPTSGTNHRESTGKQTSYTVSAADVPTGTAKFRIYVGAASKTYPCHYSEMLRESTVTVSVYLLETQKELKLNISVQPRYAHITWNNLRRAKYYVYSAYDITSSYYIYNRVEANSLGFELDEDVLISGHKYRIWVGAYNDADELISQKLIDEITPWLACSHPVTMKQDFKGYYKQEEITPQYHILYNGYNIICSSCEEVLEKNLTECLGEQEHEYSPDGVCLICHYANSECTHESTSKKYAPTTYEPENKDTHTMIRRFDVVCDYCSAVIPLRTSESYELNRTERTKGLAHNFVGKTCAECGYVKADELTLTLQRGQSSAKVGETITASASISGGSGTYKLRWKVYCDDICMNDDVTGAWISAKEHSASYTTDRAGSWYFEASVSDSEGESVTATTRTISVTTDECQHDYQTIEQADKLEYIKVNDVQHRVNHYYASVCTLCGDVKNTWIREEFMPHSFDADGKCICGAIKEEDPECVHEWKSVSSDTKIEQSNLNDRMEKHKVTTVYSDVCTKCGSLGNHEIVEYVAHLFDENGNCACGYVKVTEECDHATIGIPEGDPIIKYIDDATHSVTTYERHQCACGQVNELREVTVQAPHTFENGYCVCGAHKHSFEKHHISTTYVNPSNTQHTVTEVSQQICSTCSEKLPEEVTTRQETHSFTSKRIAEPTYTNVNDNQHKVTEIYQKTCSVCGYQAKETKTWNQNHTFSEPTIDSIHDTAKGGHLVTAKCSICKAEKTFYGALASCDQCNSSGAQLPSTAGPYSCTFTGNHQWEVRYEVSHPHKAYLQCTVCNEKKETDTDSYLPGKAVNCCDCNGHTLGDVYRDKNTRKYYRRCTSCKVYSIEVTPDPSLKAYYDVMDQQARTKTMSENFPGKSDFRSSSWTHVADKATDTLTNKGFVATKEGLEAVSEKGKTISNAITDGITGDMWEQQQAEIWEELIRQMLTNEYKQSGNTYDDAVDTLKNISDSIGISDDAVSGVGKYYINLYETACDNLLKSYKSLLEQLPDEQKALLNNQIQDIENIKKTYEDEKNTLDETSESFKAFGTAMNILESLASGASAKAEVAQRNQEYAAMMLDSVNNLDKLNSIITAARRTGNTALLTAALTVRTELTNQLENGINQYTEGVAFLFSSSLAGGETVASKTIDDALNLLPGMKELEFAAKVASKVVNWGEAYDSAEELMTLQVMNANMNIYTALEKSDSSTMAELWGYLQVRGCDAANDFLQKYEDANFLSTKDFGIGKKKLKDAQNELDDEKKDYKLFIQKQHSN